MKILITGANGLIGKYITEQLAESNHTLLVTDFQKKETNIQKSNVEWFFEDLANIENYKAKVKEFNPDVVVHLAWQGIPDFSESMSLLNLNNSIKLLNFIIEKTNCNKIIVSGSCFEYGGKTGAVKETDDSTINSFFSWAKHSLYKYMEFKCAQKEVQLVWFRYFYVYGPGQRKASLVPMILDSFKNGTTPDIRNPYNRNDFIFVQDIALATDYIINYKSGTIELLNEKALDPNADLIVKYETTGISN